MSRYDGLIIPRSYNEYINKTDPVAMSQALQLNNVLAQKVAAGNNKAVTSSAVNNALANQKGVQIETINDQYMLGSDEDKFGLNMKNSDIIGVNGIWADDKADSLGEGLNFKRSNSNYDGFKILDGIPSIDLNVNPKNRTSDGNVIIPTLVHTKHITEADNFAETYRLGDLLITLIRKTVTVDISFPSGNIFFGQISAISFPIAYKEKPTVNVSTFSKNSNCWIWGSFEQTLNNTGEFFVARGTALPSVTVVVNVIAVGIV